MQGSIDVSYLSDVILLLRFFAPLLSERPAPDA